MTGPYFVRVLTISVSGVGGNVGRLTAIGTAGSLIGTILIGYVLIPNQANSVTMYETAGALMCITVIYFLIWGRLRALGGIAAAAGAILTITLGGAGVEQDGESHFTGYEVLYRGNSNFGQMQVIRSHNDGRRFYLNDFLTQNTYDPATGQSTSLFTYMLHGLARVYTPRIDTALCIGMGAGIVPMELARDGVKVDVVEINPAVAPMSEQFFGLDPGQIHIITGDGRPYVNSTSQRYDAIILDAFLGDSTPSHLMSHEAFAGMRRILNPGGVLVINAFCEFEPGKDFFAGSLDKTLKSVFKSVRIHSGSGNVFFVASDQTKLDFLHEPEIESVHPLVKGEVEAAYNDIRQVNPKSGIVLTDDYNAIEYYDAANREEYRRYTAMAMKKK
jgi:spermidine synthase